MIKIFKFLVFFLSIFTIKVYGFSERGMLPEGHEWRECRPGMVIDCKILECDSICAANLEAERQEKEAQREEKIEELIDEYQEGDAPEKNPALFQLQQ